MSNKIDSKHFKRDCHAIMVSGYQKSVNAYDSSIADIAIMNDLLSQEDWEEMGRLIDYEAEDLPVELLQELMAILVSHGAY